MNINLKMHLEILDRKIETLDKKIFTIKLESLDNLKNLKVACLA